MVKRPKTPPFHGGNTSSNLVRVTKIGKHHKMLADFSLSINLKFYFCGVHAASFVFPLTCAAEKHIISEKPLNKRFFKGTGVVLAGIECSPKIFDFRASGIPVQERVDFFDTLKSASIIRCLPIFLFHSVILFIRRCLLFFYYPQKLLYFYPVSAIQAAF